MRPGLRPRRRAPRRSGRGPHQFLRPRGPERVPGLAATGGLMQHFIHENKIRRYSRFGTATTVVGLGLMVASIVLALTRQELIPLTILLSFTGLTVSQVG